MVVSPAIDVRDLRKYYGAKAAVDGLSLQVPRGCFFGFLGPNGAGKTTTIRMLMGVNTPTSGQIEILGLRMPTDGVAIKRQIGLVPEDTLLFDHLTAHEYMEFTGRIYGLPGPMTRERTRELLALFEMDTQGSKLIGEFSKGMRKRVAMAAALLHRPQLFLMDEPFEGVDAVGAHRQHLDGHQQHPALARLVHSNLRLRAADTLRTADGFVLVDAHREALAREVQPRDRVGGPGRDEQ